MTEQLKGITPEEMEGLEFMADGAPPAEETVEKVNTLLRRLETWAVNTGYEFDPTMDTAGNQTALLQHLDSLFERKNGRRMMISEISKRTPMQYRKLWKYEAVEVCEDTVGNVDTGVSKFTLSDPMLAQHIVQVHNAWHVLLREFFATLMTEDEKSSLPDRIESLIKLRQQARTGRYDWETDSSGVIYPAGGGDGMAVAIEMYWEDAEYVAALHNTLPALLKNLQRAISIGKGRVYACVYDSVNFEDGEVADEFSWQTMVENAVDDLATIIGRNAAEEYRTKALKTAKKESGVEDDDKA